MYLAGTGSRTTAGRAGSGAPAWEIRMLTRR